MVATRRDHVRVERFEDDAVVLNTQTNEATALNNVALVVYDCCDGSHDLAGVVARLNEAGLGPADDDAVYLALDDLAKVELIDVQIDLPESVSRRSLLKKLATGAAAGAALLPVVEMIAAPPAYAQGSNPAPTKPTPRPVASPTQRPTAPTPSPTSRPTPRPVASPTQRPTAPTPSPTTTP